MNNTLNMHQHASSRLFKIAAQLRKNPTPTEKIMWQHLRNRKLGVKFRRQHPLSIYILDLYSHEIRLAIEIDGKYHLKKQVHQMDEHRNENLIASGLTILRITDEEIISDIDKVLFKIKEIIETLKRANIQVNLDH